MSAKRILKLWIVITLCYGAMLYKCDAKSDSSSEKGQVELKNDYPLKPVPYLRVELSDEFWAPRIETNRKITIPYAFNKCKETGRINNFAIAGGLIEGEHRGDFPFDDTDPYKILEGASYSLSVHPDPELEKYLDELITKIAAAQESDGYLYTCRTNKCERLKNWYGDARWSKLNGSHELYNMGHLYEAAVAHYLATGKRTLLNVATKNADFLCDEFGSGKCERWPGHQVIEMGLAKLYRVTGKEKYLELAKFFLDTRGPGGGGYSQSHKKVIEQNEAVGHAVRATYMYSGMVDVAMLTGEQAYLDAAERIWNNVVGRKLYVTGGIGATGKGEAFSKDYELPNATAYCETCASIGNMFWNHRMFLAKGDAKYIDVMERTLYNAFLSGISLEGNSFFYPNPLESHGNHKRSGWFSCACCPGNIVRFIASLPGYVYAQTDDTLYVNLFAAGTSAIDVGKNKVCVIQETKYPWDGAVKMTIQPEQPGTFGICVRIPGWAQGRPVPSDLYRYLGDIKSQVSLRVNGDSLPVKVEKGYVRIERKWNDGDVIELDLPMPIHRVLAHEKVNADVGRVTLERGPIVYCAEWPDNNGHVLNLVMPDNAKLTAEHREDMFNGVTVIRTKAVAVSHDEEGKTASKKEHELVAIPYYAWAHRGPGEMAVWLARDESVAEPISSEDKDL